LARINGAVALAKSLRALGVRAWLGLGATANMSLAGPLAIHARTEATP